MVLARLPGAPAGTKGISLFLVPKILPPGYESFAVRVGSRDVGDVARNDVVLGAFNKKMGQVGCTNAGELLFGQSEGSSGAVGFLVGEANKGLPAMFCMMNEMRVSVGL